ncbi:hypothetical protein F511_03233 [Dorcoceras hygrometricum]|uniref:Uncharacterized protein n=1 Tax=Dorcoceras hygrometricum TaxID=472368 RepID=A0A2Z7B372_9LAMI|nr:hypothetical protein F511_03233 [Dorcoceras hygrometricum]
MPQVDFDALITAHSGEGKDYDHKIPCITLDEEEYSSEDEVDIPGGQYDIVQPDDPPESFWLSKDAEYDWLDRNAFYERRDSTRGNSNSTTLNPHIKPTSSNHNSQRFSANLKSKASIIGLPKTHKATFVDSSCRRTCKTSTNSRLFPKRTTSAVAITEPCSPKVSCTGRVRSKRGRRRSNSSKRSDKPAEKARAFHGKPAEESKTGAAGKEEKQKKNGFYSKVMSIFRSKKTHKKSSFSYSRKVAEVQAEKPEAAEMLRKSSSIRAASEPPGLSGIKRFASGRKSGSWLAEDLNQVYPEPLDFDRRVCITGRRWSPQ